MGQRSLSLFCYNTITVSVIIDARGIVWFDKCAIVQISQESVPGDNNNIWYCKIYRDIPTPFLYKNITDKDDEILFINLHNTMKIIWKRNLLSFAYWINDNILHANFYTKLERKISTKRRERLQGFIYLFCSDDNDNVYKLGRTKNIKSRLATLNVGRVHSLLYVYNYFYVKNSLQMEKELHHHFSSQRIRGEFYKLTSQDLTYISKKCHHQSAQGLEG
nr:hypothetical protein [Microctonus hyperodae filamentous virus]